MYEVRMLLVPLGNKLTHLESPRVTGGDIRTYTDINNICPDEGLFLK